jgi:hypothetical protein
MFPKKNKKQKNKKQIAKHRGISITYGVIWRLPFKLDPRLNSSPLFRKALFNHGKSTRTQVDYLATAGRLGLRELLQPERSAPHLPGRQRTPQRGRLARGSGRAAGTRGDEPARRGLPRPHSAGGGSGQARRPAGRVVTARQSLRGSPPSPRTWPAARGPAREPPIARRGAGAGAGARTARSSRGQGQRAPRLADRGQSCTSLRRGPGVQAGALNPGEGTRARETRRPQNRAPPSPSQAPAATLPTPAASEGDRGKCPRGSGLEARISQKVPRRGLRPWPRGATPDPRSAAVSGFPHTHKRCLMRRHQLCLRLVQALVGDGHDLVEDVADVLLPSWPCGGGGKAMPPCTEWPARFTPARVCSILD